MFIFSFSGFEKGKSHNKTRDFRLKGSDDGRVAVPQCFH